MMKFVLSTLLITLTSAAAAQSAADTYCKQMIAETSRYQNGFGTIELSGSPLIFDTGPVEHSVMTIIFPDQEVILTVDNVHAGALGDYIATTIAHRERGHEAFGVITDDADGNRLGLIQPYEHDGSPHCFGSVVRTSD